MEIIDVEVIKCANAQAGQYWFSPDTTRFFRSRYPQCVYKVGDKAYFITSEQCENEPRKYSIRVFTFSDSCVDTLGMFNGLTKGQAQYRFKKLIEKLESGVDVI